MAFGDDNSDLRSIANTSPLGNPPGNVGMLWAYRTNDTADVVEADGYFDSVANDPLREGDLILASVDEDGTNQVKFYTASVGGGDVTIVGAANSTSKLTDSTGGTPGDTLTAPTNTQALTDNSGGTASATIADITEANNAGSADRVPTEDAIATLAAELATQRTLNLLLFDYTASLAAKINALLDSQGVL